MGTTVEQLLQRLRRGIATPRELQAGLGISAPTLSRLVARAGDTVCRLGQTRATRYASTRSLPGLGSKLPVFRIDEAGKVSPAGTLWLLCEGRHWLEEPDGTGTLFDGLPPFAAEMSPQGFLGRSFSAVHPDLGLPARLADWNDDHHLVALARRGEDCVGDLVIGTESLDRLLARKVDGANPKQFAKLALAAAQGQAGASAGGEHPKFLAFVDGSHRLVKFADADPGAASTRWRDLLVCEELGLQVLREAGLPAANARGRVVQGFRFLEVERFDRVGDRGRRGILSLAAIDAEYIGRAGTWSQLAPDMVEAGMLGADDARRMRWLDTFGDLIANTDRHLGNISFFVPREPSAPYVLAPIYDMLPMRFAPATTTVVEREFVPSPPNSTNYDLWSEAAMHAARFWKLVAHAPALSKNFREIAGRCAGILNQLR